MYKIVLIEDEDTVREKMRSSMDWNSIGFTICGEAPDGEAGFALIETEKPDVVITDIKMPFLDGISMSKLVRKKNPKVKIIVLSGFNDFKFAQELISVGVYQYLLKPISPFALKDSLVKLKEILDNEKREEEERENLNIAASRNRVFAEELFFYNLLFGNVSVHDAVDLGVEIVSGEYKVVFIESRVVDGVQLGLDGVNESVNRLATLEGVSYHLIKATEHNMIVLVWGSDVSGFVKALSDEEKARDDRPDTGVPFDIVFGKTVHRISDINTSFKGAFEKSMFDRSLMQCWQNDSSIDFRFLIAFENGLSDMLRTKSLEENYKFIEDNLDRFGEKIANSSMLYTYYIIDIMRICTKAMDDMNDGETDVRDFFNRHDILYNEHSSQNARDFTKNIVKMVIEDRDSMLDSKAITVEKAKVYLENNYSNPLLCLKDVAIAVNVSPNYLSQIFKSVAGISFVQYLRDVRIIKAKELIRSRSYSAEQISAMVGYNDPNYFSTVFKKETNCTVREYRRRTEQNGN